jgi:hypothetical protein
VDVKQGNMLTETFTPPQNGKSVTNPQISAEFPPEEVKLNLDF